MNISFTAEKIPTSGTLVLGIDEKKTFDSFHALICEQMKGGLRKAVESTNFSAKKGSFLTIPAPYGLTVSQVIVISLGNDTQTTLSLTEFGAKIAEILGKCLDTDMTVYIPQHKNSFTDQSIPAAYVADGFNLRSWHFDKYHTKKDKKNQCAITSAYFIAQNPETAEKTFEPLRKIADGVFLTRHVVSEPPNVIYPKTLAHEAKSLESLGLKVHILDEQAMKKLGMNALLGVGQGSEKESYLVVLEWHGGEKDDAPIAIVGKGVTFDTGGISIKPSQDMDDMKYDMGGSGVVLGLMRALAGRKAKVNVVGVMGLAENMPDGNAQRPGDIVTSLSGQTIEILNTDAEGRLVLADALWYTQNSYKPKVMIDLATLTGAIVISLGNEHAGLFSNNDSLAQKLEDASKKTGEKLWRLPLSDAYDKDIDSVVADVKNIGSGRGAGSITAAQFLQRFVNNTPWAHIDIAGTAWDKKGRPLTGKGATAFGVRLLNQFLADHYEK